jgi:hypothetical protein
MLKKTWGSASLRKETLKNRREDFRSKVLKICKGVEKAHSTLCPKI